MKVHVLQHVPFEGIGSMESWLNARDAGISYTRFYEPTALPAIDSIDLVIAMGGPMSVNDEASLPWLIEEKQFLREAIQHEVAVVGICLGAQLIASALGARVYANPQEEIGWFEIEATPDASRVFRFPDKAMVYHWHSETFDLPPGGVRLAKSAGCKNQAFQIGANVIGLQFHLESTRQSTDSIITHCGDTLVEGTYVQSAKAMRAMSDSAYESSRRLMSDVLSHIMK